MRSDWIITFGLRSCLRKSLPLSVQFNSARSGRRGQWSYLNNTVWVKCGLLAAFLRSVQLADKEHNSEADLSFLLAVAEDDANNDEAK